MVGFLCEVSGFGARPFVRDREGGSLQKGFREVLQDFGDLVLGLFGCFMVCSPFENWITLHL